MSVFVLAVGALLVAAGVYEMIVGSGDILSERGWSAFIAGSVFVAGGISTVALGLAVQAVDRLRVAILRPSVPSNLAPMSILDEPAQPTVAAPAAPPAPVPRTEPPVDEAPTAPLTVAPPIGAAAHAEDPVSATESQIPLVSHPEPLPESSLPSSDFDARRDDWLDQSFAELEHDVSAHSEDVRETTHPAPAAVHEGRGLETPDAETHLHDPAPPLDTIPHPEAEAAGAPGSAVIEAAPSRRDHFDGEAALEPATIAAREEPPPSEAQVIGRYESEGTSYVMYADGSIDAQSEAGVYRFASMAELKAFIEG